MTRRATKAQKTSRTATILRLGSVLFVVLALLWWWATRTHAGSWWWAALLNIVPPQVLLPLPLWLAWRAWKTKKRGWVLLNLLGAALFTVSVVGFVLPKARPSVTGLPLTVMTLNVNYASASPARIAELAVREGADVVLLQEGVNKQRNGAAYQAQLRAAFPGWNMARHDELFTLSRLPLLKTQVVNFPNTPHAVLVTQVRDEGEVVTVVNTHLPTLGLLPSASDRRLGRNLQARIQRQLDVRWDYQHLVAGLLAAQPGPVVVGGDLNAPARGGVGEQMRALHLQDTFAAGGLGFGFTHWAYFGHSRIDQLWVRGLQVGRVAPLRDIVSDHRALVAHLTFLPSTIDQTNAAQDSTTPPAAQSEPLKR